MPTIITPRPPLNLFEVVRITVDDTYTTVYETPIYEIPASGPNPARFVDAAAIFTSLIISNTSAGAATFSIQILDVNSVAFSVAVDQNVSAGDFVSVNMDRQILMTNETLQVKMNTGNTSEVHFSFVLNQREEFTVI